MLASFTLRHVGAAYNAASVGCLLRQLDIPRPSRTRSPQIPASARQSPQSHGGNVLLVPGIPAYPRPPRKDQDRPVTPEVAGSSPVAPVKIPVNGIF